MPRDNTIHRILLIGSGPIVIGQGCEFDYSGVQACKALKEEGYEVILVNSNPATIMTDPEFAHRTYIEPITPEVVAKIIEKEKPDALLPTLGGQTALNCAMKLHEMGVLERNNVRMIGAKPEAIHKGEDRQAFKEAMIKIGLDMPQSGTARTIDEARKIAAEIGRLPLIIRPAFTLGGTGGGIAYNREEFETIVTRGLDLSPVSEVLVEESLLGWKEYEMEVMRDKADNCVIICSIENFDPMGVHTGDSITVAPAQTLTDKEFQVMRDASFAVIREIGVETGGSNIQFSVNPENGRMIVIEMNPRVSRSSALASKATGFPIAKIAAKLAVGYTLDEVKNDITRETPASFEPTIDYVVVKVPRFTFEKFPQADATLTTQMKSVGEAMAIGRTFKESLQKALRSLEIKRFGLMGDGAEQAVDDDTLRRKLTIPNAERIFFLGQALQRGWSVEEIFEMTKIDRWFLENLRQIVEHSTAMSVQGCSTAKGSACVPHAAADVPSGASQPSAEGARYQRRRLPHFERPWAKYSITFSTKDRAPLSPEARTTVLNAILHFHTSRYELFAACVMPDHVHLLMEPSVKETGEDGTPVFWSLSELMHSLKSFTAHEINKTENVVGTSVWETEWHDRIIRSESDLQEKFEYITRNPWDSSLVGPKEHYEWVWWHGSAPESSTSTAARRDAGQNTRDACATLGDATLPGSSTMPALGANGGAMSRAELLRAKKFGFSDRQIAIAKGVSDRQVRTWRRDEGVIPTYRLVDTCAAEFEAYTPYYYSTYGDENERRESGRKKIIILGGGPNRIGQGIEFDYCCVHAAFALRELGFETIMVNSNPETVSTDYDTSDKLYFEPLTLEDVLNICEQERENLFGVIVQFGGQTPLNLANGLAEAGVPIIGTSPRSIEIAEDRKLFAAMLDKLGIRQTPGATATNEAEAVEIAARIGYPVLVRPSFVLGGRAMELVHEESDLRRYIRTAVEASPERPVLVDRFLEDATEVDVDCISDGHTVVIGAIMEHIEEAGIHSGDSACVIPPYSLSEKVKAEIASATKAMAKELNVIGLMNVQFAVKDEQVYVIEVNPRASRTSPFVSKAIGVALPKLAAKIMAGKTLAELGFTEEIIPTHYSVKEAVFPFTKFPGVDIVLGPEMKSTGEVMGIDQNMGLAYAKAQMAAQPSLPLAGNIFISVPERTKERAVEIARGFADLGFTLYATSGTAATLQTAGIEVKKLFKLGEGRPHALDMLKNGDLAMIINTPHGKTAREDEVKIRSTASSSRVPVITTLRAAQASLEGIRALKEHGLSVKPLQEYTPTRQSV